MTARLHTLPNGVRVVCDPMEGLQSLALSVVVRGGARWESEAYNGWSHLLEHMVFKGAGERSAQDIVEAIEGQGGQINAATGYERTSFQVRCLKGGLPLAVEVLTDLVRQPILNAADLEQEKGVIGQEIAEAADQPDDRVFDLAQSRAFSGQAMGRPILGEPETIGTATPETLRAYHEALYDPSRIVVSAAGAVDEDELLALAMAAFGDARSNGASLAPEVASFASGSLAEARKLEQAHLVLLLNGVSARDPDYFAMRLFAEALGGGMASRLFQVVREARGLAYAIDAYCENYEDVGLFGIYAGTSAGDAGEAARLSAEQVLLLAEAPTVAELARAKAQLKSHLFMARESPLSRAEQAAGQLHLFDRLFTPESLAEGVDAVTLEDLRRVGGRLVQGGLASAVLGPKKAGGAGEAFAARLKG